jgi:hypothetical protein
MENTESQVAKSASRAYAALVCDLRTLERAARANPPAAELHAYLCTTRSDLAEYFRSPEETGDIEAIQDQQPRLAPAIDRLVEEHRELTQALDALIAECAAARTLTEALRSKVRDWIGQARRVETHEVDFIQDAVDRDIGIKD